MAAASVLCSIVSAVGANSPANPYARIAQRNLFLLREPPAAAPAPEAKPTLPKIFLTGITTILGRRQALLKIPAHSGKPGETPSGDQFFILGEGQRQGKLSVLQIHEKTGSVAISYGSQVLKLTFEANGVKEVRMARSGPGAVGAARPWPDAFRGRSSGFAPPSRREGGVRAGAGAPARLGRRSGPAHRPLTAEEEAALIEVQRRLRPNASQTALLPPTGL
jgi:hypothetical protein